MSLGTLKKQAAVLCLLILFGCGHDVGPTAEFSNPGDIPLAEDVRAIPGIAGVNLSWLNEPTIFAFIDGWNIYRAVGEGPHDDGDFERINGDLFTELAFVDRFVEDGELYWYRITSVTPAGIESLPAIPSPPWVRVDLTPPGAPQGVEAVVDSLGTVTVTWDENPEPDLSHYNVFREAAGGVSVFGPIPPVIGLFQDFGLPSGDYRYWVTAVDVGSNEGPASEAVEVTIP